MAKYICEELSSERKFSLDYETEMRVAERMRGLKLDQIYRIVIADALETSRGNLTKAAKIVGMSRSKIYRYVYDNDMQNFVKDLRNYRRSE
jgi:DNA-binding NtrC family response regulator